MGDSTARLDAFTDAAFAWLRRTGYRVLLARGGEEALALAAEHGDSIDLVLTDLVMPAMSGREIAGRLCAARPGCRCCSCPATPTTQVVRHGLDRATVRLVQKPFTATALCRAVRGVLGPRRQSPGLQPSRPVAPDR